VKYGGEDKQKSTASNAADDGCEVAEIVSAYNGDETAKCTNKHP
jgi:hypothetical protein